MNNNIIFINFWKTLTKIKTIIRFFFARSIGGDRRAGKTRQFS